MAEVSIIANKHLGERVSGNGEKIMVLKWQSYQDLVTDMVWECGEGEI